MYRFVFLLLLPLLCVAVPAESAWAGNHPAHTTTQRTATPSDAQIEAAIKAKLAKSKIGKDGFRFHVQRGVVTWEGSTNVIQHKGSATRMARTAGAVQVVNNIQISAAAREKAAGNLKKATVQD
jgi:hypothetical protein